MFKATGRAAGLAAAASLITIPGFAAGLAINGMPASTAASRVGQAFDANIDIGPGLNPNQQVSFNVPDTSLVGARTSAVTYLAHQLNAKRRTVLVVSRSNGTAWKAPAALDTTTLVTFNSRTLPASAVLHQIAYVDNADIQLKTPLSGSVTLSSLSLPATVAAEQLALQTHTTLDVEYRLMSRSNPMASATPGTIIGYTDGGRPITSDLVVLGRKPAHRTTSTKRYAHRNSRGSIIITSSALSAAAQNANPNTVYGTPAATLIAPGPAQVQMFPLPRDNSLFFNPYWYSPYEYPYSYPTGIWGSPYSVGNGITILPSAPAGPTVVVP